ncbi:hypothetical protein P4O66_004611 [Electrophorus voltai]|uniref:Uncharacterized protein n=1 Tax=Electrophorus voltai TaxID=2609070 RepID=A0AAD9E440_9TELE|nr:hypothetical protein P4O66_004611 [Electrophorus voltai]
MSSAQGEEQGLQHSVHYVVLHLISSKGSTKFTGRRQCEGDSVTAQSQRSASSAALSTAPSGHSQTQHYLIHSTGSGGHSCNELESPRSCTVKTSPCFILPHPVPLQHKQLCSRGSRFQLAVRTGISSENAPHNDTGWTLHRAQGFYTTQAGLYTVHKDSTRHRLDSTPCTRILHDTGWTLHRAQGFYTTQAGLYTVHKDSTRHRLDSTPCTRILHDTGWTLHRAQGFYTTQAGLYTVHKDSTRHRLDSTQCTRILHDTGWTLHSAQGFYTTQAGLYTVHKDSTRHRLDSTQCTRILHDTGWTLHSAASLSSSRLAWGLVDPGLHIHTSSWPRALPELQKPVMGNEEPGVCALTAQAHRALPEEADTSDFAYEEQLLFKQHLHDATGALCDTVIETCISGDMGKQTGLSPLNPGGPAQRGSVPLSSRAANGGFRSSACRSSSGKDSPQNRGTFPLDQRAGRCTGARLCQLFINRQSWGLHFLKLSTSRFKSLWRRWMAAVVGVVAGGADGGVNQQLLPPVRTAVALSGSSRTTGRPRGRWAALLARPAPCYTGSTGKRRSRVRHLTWCRRGSFTPIPNIQPAYTTPPPVPQASPGDGNGIKASACKSLQAASVCKHLHLPPNPHRTRPSPGHPSALVQPEAWPVSSRAERLADGAAVGVAVPRLRSLYGYLQHSCSKYKLPFHCRLLKRRCAVRLVQETNAKTEAALPTPAERSGLLGVQPLINPGLWQRAQWWHTGAGCLMALLHPEPEQQPCATPEAKLNTEPVSPRGPASSQRLGGEAAASLPVAPGGHGHRLPSTRKERERLGGERERERERERESIACSAMGKLLLLVLRADVTSPASTKPFQSQRLISKPASILSIAESENSTAKHDQLPGTADVANVLRFIQNGPETKQTVRAEGPERLFEAGLLEKWAHDPYGGHPGPGTGASTRVGLGTGSTRAASWPARARAHCGPSFPGQGVEAEAQTDEEEEEEEKKISDRWTLPCFINTEAAEHLQKHAASMRWLAVQMGACLLPRATRSPARGQSPGGTGTHRRPQLAHAFISHYIRPVTNRPAEAKLGPLTRRISPTGLDAVRCRNTSNCLCRSPSRGSGVTASGNKGEAVYDISLDHIMAYYVKLSWLTARYIAWSYRGQDRRARTEAFQLFHFSESQGRGDLGVYVTSDLGVYVTSECMRCVCDQKPRDWWGGWAEAMSLDTR